MATNDEAGAGTALAEQDPAQAEIIELAEVFEEELARVTRAPGWDLPTWFLGKLAEIDGVRAALKDRYQELLAAVNRREQALHWKLGARFKLAVDAALDKQNAGKKKPTKSVTFLTGKAGYRSSVPTLSIIDEPALKAWCLEHCEEALELKIQRTTPIKAVVKATGEVPPGVLWKDAEERFYPAVDLAALAEKGATAAELAAGEGGAA